MWFQELYSFELFFKLNGDQKKFIDFLIVDNFGDVDVLN